MKKLFLAIFVGVIFIADAMDVDVRQSLPDYSTDLGVFLQRVIPAQLALSIARAKGCGVARLEYFFDLMKYFLNTVSSADWRAIDDWGNELTKRLRNYKRWECLRDGGKKRFIFPVLCIRSATIDMNGVCAFVEGGCTPPSYDELSQRLILLGKRIDVERASRYDYHRFDLIIDTV